MRYSRNRILYIILIATAASLGLTVRRYAVFLPKLLALYSGDILWALMVYLIIGFLLPKMRIIHTALAAFAFSALIEVSQLYHAPWIDAIRHTRLGGLVLGYGFLWSDILCYFVGICMGLVAEYLVYRRK